MMAIIRKAQKADLSAVAEIYEKILTKQDQGQASTGWVRGVYPTITTAKAALAADDLFVMEAEGRIVGSCRLNREQVREYANCPWSVSVPEDQVMVLHTLTIDPEQSGKGYGKQFVAYYERYARAQGCPCLRMDTNVINLAARAMYEKLGFREAGIVESEFNGIPGVRLVCLEKTLEEDHA